MRLGLIARSDNSGLGLQTLEFYKHMRPDKTMVVDISEYNHNPTYPERYSADPIGNITFVTGFPRGEVINEFLQDLDVLFIAESAYNPYVYARAKEVGIKTAVQYNYEFFDWFNAKPEVTPDMFIAPSKWHYDDVDKFCQEKGIKHVYLHCPVNQQALPFREIKQARMFLHSGGKSAAFDRNGTDTVIQASKYLTTDAKIFIHFQGEQGLSHQATHLIDHYHEFLREHGDPNKVVIQQWEYPNYADVYNDADVLLLPRRYGGNCLPLNEALSIGMPVLMTDISPNNEFLPKSWLIPSVKIAQFEPRTVVDIYAAMPQELAASIDEFYNMDEVAMAQHNHLAGALADEISWDTMAPKYREELEKLCTQ